MTANATVPVEPANDVPVPRDDFSGDNEGLRRSIQALLALDSANALWPHGIGGHARTLLIASYHRIAAAPQPEATQEVDQVARELLAVALDECGRPTDAAEVREGRNPFVRGEYALAAIAAALRSKQAAGEAAHPVTAALAGREGAKRDWVERRGKPNRVAVSA